MKASLRRRLAAFARDCVVNGDMTPSAEQMLMHILTNEEHCMRCNCPVNEHDALGRCNALDVPEMGVVRECNCAGLLLADGD